WADLRQRVEPLRELGRKRPKVTAAVAALVVIALAAIIWGEISHGRGQTGTMPAMTITVTHLSDQRLRTAVSGIGSVVAWEELSIAAEAQGLRVDKVLVDEGDLVKQGQVLAQLDARVLQAQLRQAEARVAEAKSTLAVAENNHRRA